MTCFWDGIINSLDTNDLNKIQIQTKPTVDLFIEKIKSHNRKTKNVLWNNTTISEQQLEENYNAVKDYDQTTKNEGYYCSTFDPIIFLVSEIFELNIEHKYLKNIINYTHENYIKTVNYNSSRSHFTYVGTKMKDDE